jgi:hypothetical protein
MPNRFLRMRDRLQALCSLSRTCDDLGDRTEALFLNTIRRYEARLVLSYRENAADTPPIDLRTCWLR